MPEQEILGMYRSEAWGRYTWDVGWHWRGDISVDAIHQAIYAAELQQLLHDKDRHIDMVMHPKTWGDLQRTAMQSRLYLNIQRSPLGAEEIATMGPVHFHTQRAMPEGEWETRVRMAEVTRVADWEVSEEAAKREEEAREAYRTFMQLARGFRPDTATEEERKKLDRAMRDWQLAGCPMEFGIVFKKHGTVVG